jgi:arsenite methyltransferase
METMKTSEELKELVKSTYTKVAAQSKDENAASCCGATGCSTIDSAVMAEDYSKISGYAPEADLGLGCGLPTEFALLKESQTVLDLGSGAGNDAFVARSVVGSTGRVIGLDFTEAMIRKARINADKLGYNNVEFRQGDIEEMPIGDNSVDVIVSNCVLNLVPDKAKAFQEMYRVMKDGGHFSVSDIVLVGPLPRSLQKQAELYAGCVSGAIQKDEYLESVKQAGFTEVTIQREKKINLPDDLLTEYLTPEEIAALKKVNGGIYSITLFGKKAGETKSASTTETKAKTCCGPECCN